MAIIQCKVCGGDIELSSGNTFGTCKYCGIPTTLPKIDDEQRAAAFNRGNHFRRIGEFDKALTGYERIVQEDDSDAEAHWCCALCRFGIEYVEDPATYEWLPTCHRASFDNFLEDVDYLAALEHSDGITRRQYQKDGVKIAEVQRGILATSRNEDPFDVFICYKELDNAGNRTVDSTLAQDIYYQLAEKDYRVFFSRITLEDKAGSQYEPYIFAALNSAKVMVAVGTKAEHFNAVWVKNEWSRYLALMRKDRKKLLLPCYRDMDPYDLPEQLSILQSYDMGKIGFIQDLIRGVSKVLDADKVAPTATKETIVVQGEGSGNLTALLKRGNMMLEDGEWAKADEFFEQVLNQDAECAEAYLGKALVEQKCSSLEMLVEKRRQPGELKAEKLTACDKDMVRIDAAVEKYQIQKFLHENAIRRKFEGFDLAYSSVVASVGKRLEQEKDYFKTDKLMGRALRYAKGNFANRLNEAYIQVVTVFQKMLAEAKAEDRANVECITAEYAVFMEQKEQELSECYVESKRYKEAEEAEFKRMEEECKEYERFKAERERLRGKWLKITMSVMVGAVIASVIVTKWIIPEYHYKQAKTLLMEGDYDGAIEAFEKIGENTTVSSSRLSEARYAQAEYLQSTGDHNGAALRFAQAGYYKDAMERIVALSDVKAVSIPAAAHTATLKPDGTVQAVGDNKYGQCEVSEWRDIEAVSVGGEDTVGHTIGLQSDGTVVAVGSNEYGQCEVSKWRDIKAVSAGIAHTVGLRFDGTVVAVGDNEYSQCNVSSWTDVVAVAAGGYRTVGMKSDGTVVTTGDWDSIVSDWRDVVVIVVGEDFIRYEQSDGLSGGVHSSN